MISKLTILDQDEELPAADEVLYRASDVPETHGLPVRRRAAVLMPLLRRPDGWHLLFIRRATSDRDRHSGQVAFPGGGHESQDRDDVDTALREAHEEIGLAQDRVQVLTALEPYVTVTRYRVVPVVGVIDGLHSLRLQANEVARAFTIPLSWLRRREHLSFRARDGADPAIARRHPVIVYEPYDGETLWGASARMTLNLLKEIDRGGIVLPERPPTDPANA